MKRSLRFLFGPLGAAIFCVGVPVLALMVPRLQSRASDRRARSAPWIRPAGSTFALMLGSISVCMFVFASAVRDASAIAGRNQIAAYLIACMALSGLGVAIFATPHPLHNVFGLSEIVGYQAPLAFALAWRNDPKVRTLVLLVMDSVRASMGIHGPGT